MQTFLPYPDFVQSARCLDYRRLGKQRVETLQIIMALRDPAYGWQNHPAVLMWRGHDRVLCQYGIAICSEWRARGYRDTCLDKIDALLAKTEPCDDPAWLGFEPFHRAHRSNLLRKDPEYYGRLWSEPDDLPYLWGIPS